MRMDAKTAEQAQLLHAAQAMLAAARTAPKAKGQDYLEGCILDGEEKEQLAAAMEEIAQQSGLAFIKRDAGCVRAAGVIVMFGIGRHTRGLDKTCQFCGMPGCSACLEQGACCVYDPIDLGIAMGSAVSIAADLRVDNRILFSAGVGAKKIGIFPEDITMVFGIPLSISGKTPFFDRK